MAGASTVSRRVLLIGRSSPTAARRIAAISDRCLAHSGVFCMSCRDACLDQAIRFSPRVGGAFVPEIIATACSGCAACIDRCPAQAISMSDWSHEASEA